MLEIDNTPFPSSRVVAGKYEELFGSLKPGQCVKTEPDRVGTVSQAMRKWLAKTGRTDVKVCSVKQMPDKFGRVYLMPTKPLKMADVPGRKINKLGAWEEKAALCA